MSEDQSNEIPDANIDADAIQKSPPDTSGESNSSEDSEEEDEDNDDLSIIDPSELEKNLQDDSEESYQYSYNTKDYPEESSFFKSSDNDFDFMANYEDKTEENERKVEEMLCAVLDMCDWPSRDYSEYSVYPENYMTDNEIKIDAQPIPNTATNVENYNSRAKRSADDKIDNENKRGHRSKRDLSWYDEADDDDVVPLDVLAEVFANDNRPVDKPQNNLIDVLSNIEGIRRDRMTAGDILEEFEEDEAMGGLPFEADDADTYFRKRGASAKDIRHFVQTLPTLEGMKKRSGLL